MSKLGKDIIAGMINALAVVRGEKKPRRVYTAPIQVPAKKGSSRAAYDRPRTSRPTKK